MITRRELLQVGAATAALTVGGGGFTRAMAQQRLTEAELLKFDALGNVTLLHVADIHGQLMPVYFREPSINLGVGEARGQPPHLTANDFLKRFGIAEKSAAAYALTSEDFSAPGEKLRPHRRARPAGHRGQARARRTRRQGAAARRRRHLAGLARRQRAAKARTWSTAWRCLKPDAMTGHWEFTYGEARVQELIKGLGFPFLALNIRDTEWNEPVFEPMKMFERGGVKIAVLGQAFPYTPVANPRWMMPKWSFGIREEEVRAQVEKARKSRRATGGAAVAQRLRRRPQAGRARARHRRDPDRPHPRRAAGSDQGRQHLADRLRQPRQVLVAASISTCRTAR